MKITCPTCETSYKLAEGAIGAGGRKVRCTRCGTTWLARADDPPPDEVTAEAEWAAVEASAPADPASAGEASDDEWRAALAGPDRKPVTGGPLPIDDDPAGAATDRELFDPGLPDSQATFGSDADADADTDAEGSAQGGVVVPFEHPDREAPEPAPEPPVIEQDPPGFARRTVRRRPPPARKKPSMSQAGKRIASALVITIAGLMVAGLLAGGLFARESVVARFPDLAGLYALVGLEVNLRGLDFRDVRTYRELDGSTPVLVVDGIIENVSDFDRLVPRLRFGLRSTSGREVYAWTMDVAAERLGPGETATFESRLPAPPEAATDVEVRFTDARGP
jgi:predicted Zn finger-like uncharacterized protein